MDRAGVDLVLATTKHNVQYLLGGYRFFFFAQMDAIGLSRYIPMVGYPRGSPESAFYIGHPAEASQQREEPPWMPTIRNEARTSEEAALVAAALIDRLGLARGTVALEMPFVPADTYLALRRLLPEGRVVNAVEILEELRAVKRPHELALIKEAAEAIVTSMQTVFDRTRPGATTQQIAELLRREETSRGLFFDYCLVATARSFDRAPSTTPWNEGATLSLDSGGSKNGYVGDMARMAVMGQPTALMHELLREVDAVQMAARRPVRTGVTGGSIYESASAELARVAHRDEINFEAHGMGLVSHEVPHLTATGGVPYPDTHADRLLKSGIVRSIETTLRHPGVGFVKLEDTVVVTDAGYEAYGDGARGWNVVEA